MRATFDERTLYPMLARQNRVCFKCHGPSGDHPYCWGCHQANDTFYDAGLEPDDVRVLPISLAVEWDPLASALWGYKNNETPGLREPQSEMVEHLLHEFLGLHGRCIGRMSGGATFTKITWIPSSRGPRQGMRHPLEEMLKRAPWNFERCNELLRRTEVDVLPHQTDLRRFETTVNVEGDTVLLIDDTWTTGANAMSATGALMRAGVERVGIVVIGRWHDPTYRDLALYSDHARSIGFQMNKCVYCGLREEPPLPVGGPGGR